jgi:hypothetical protein
MYEGIRKKYKHTIDLEHVQRNKKKEKGEFTRHQGSK